MLSDIRLGVRVLRSRPTYAGISIGTIAIGIAASVSLFNVVDGVLLHPLPFPESDRIVSIWQTRPEWRQNPVLAKQWDNVPLSLPQYRALEYANRVFSGVAAWREEGMAVGIGRRVEFARVTSATISLMHVLALQPSVGRYFVADDINPSQPPVALLSNGAWQTWFSARSDVLGSRIRIGSEEYTIVGVMPPGFSVDSRADAIARARGEPTESAVWIPAERDTASLNDNGRRNFAVIARLQPAATLELAVGVVNPAIHSTQGERRSYGVRVALWQSERTRESKGPLVLLLAGAVALLAIACINTGVLALGEAATREREISSRLALGARPAQVVRQILLETTVLVASGAACGLILSVWLTRLLVLFAPVHLVSVPISSFGGRAALFAIATTALAGVIVGSVPAVVLSRLQPAGVLRAGSGQGLRGTGAALHVLIALQVAVAVVLLFSAALIARSLQRVLAVDPGFDPSDIAVFQPELPTTIWGDTIAVRQLYGSWTERLASVPGVIGAVAATNPPFVGGSSATWINLATEDLSDANTRLTHPVQLRTVTSGFFHLMGIPLLAGSPASAQDGNATTPVVTVSSSLAIRDFGRTSAVNQRILINGQWRLITGIVGDIHTRDLVADLEPTVYLPLAQSRSWTLSVLVRTDGDARPFIAGLRRIIAEVEPRATVRSVEILESAMTRSYADSRYRTVLMLVFAAFATVLATVGVFGVTNRAVARRRREIAIRQALGAPTLALYESLLRSTVLALAVGGCIGCIAAIPVGRVLSDYLYKVSPTDPVALIFIVAILAAASITATVGPLIGSGRVDVVHALRSE